VLTRRVFWEHFLEFETRRIGMTRQGTQGREHYWRGVIEEQDSSGLPIAAFCREREVAEGSFFYWRRKLAKGQPVRKDQVPRRSRPRNNTIGKFVPVDIPAPSGTSRSSCEVVLPDGCRIIVPTQCDAGWLREILSVLGDRTC
jgi:hypothetical protein